MYASPMLSPAGLSSAAPSPAAPSPTTNSEAILRARQSLSPRASAGAMAKYYSRLHLEPLGFNSVAGRSITLTRTHTVATRQAAEYSNAYVFTERPLKIGETVVLQVRLSLLSRPCLPVGNCAMVLNSLQHYRFYESRYYITIERPEGDVPSFDYSLMFARKYYGEIDAIGTVPKSIIFLSLITVFPHLRSMC